MVYTTRCADAGGLLWYRVWRYGIGYNNETFWYQLWIKVKQGYHNVSLWIHYHNWVRSRTPQRRSSPTITRCRSPESFASAWPDNSSWCQEAWPELITDFDFRGRGLLQTDRQTKGQTSQPGYTLQKNPQCLRLGCGFWQWPWSRDWPGRRAPS